MTEVQHKEFIKLTNDLHEVSLKEDTLKTRVVAKALVAMIKDVLN